MVYLAGEGHAGLRGRVAGWKQARKVSKMRMWISKAGCDLNTPAGYIKAVNEIRKLKIKPKVIVVDTLHRFLLGDENSAQDTKTMLDACSALMREFDCTIILVHHTGVSEEAQHRARGSSAWRGALDIEISIKPAKGDEPIEMIQRKSKDAEMQEPMYFDLTSQPIIGWFDDDGDQVTTAIIEQTQAAPKQSRKESKAAEHRKTFEAAWFGTGAEIKNGSPYVTKSAMIDYLQKNRGLSESSAKQYIKAADGTKFIGALINADYISTYENGWIVVPDVDKSALILKLKGDKNDKPA